MAETIIGRALAARPDLAEGVTVTTKVGHTAAGRDYGYDAVMRSVEASRARLGLDRLEIVFIHDPMGLPLEEVLGKDRALGAPAARQRPEARRGGNFPTEFFESPDRTQRVSST